jgi:hypothetical protein
MAQVIERKESPDQIRYAIGRVQMEAFSKIVTLIVRGCKPLPHHFVNIVGAASCRDVRES